MYKVTTWYFTPGGERVKAYEDTLPRFMTALLHAKQMQKHVVDGATMIEKVKKQ